VAPGVEDVAPESFENCNDLKDVRFIADDALDPNHSTKIPDQLFKGLNVFMEVSEASLKKKRGEIKGKPIG
jgi:hypothetical protein